MVCGTLLVGWAPSLPVLVSGRLLQGGGGAGLFTLAMALAGSTRVRGTISAANGALGAVGPLLGEVTASALSWRLTLGVSAVSLLAVWPVRRQTSTSRGAGAAARSFDGWGAAALSSLIAAVVLLPHAPVPAAAMAVLALGAVVARIRARPDGFLPLPVLRNRRFLASSGLVLALSTSYFILLYLFPRLADRCCGWDASQAGLAQLCGLLVGSVATWGWTSWSSRLPERVGLGVPVAVGALAVALGLTGSLVAVLVVPVAAVFAATTGLAALTTPAAEAVPGRYRATATGLVTLSFLLGGAFGPNLAVVLAG